MEPQGRAWHGGVCVSVLSLFLWLTSHHDSTSHAAVLDVGCMPSAVGCTSRESSPCCCSQQSRRLRPSGGAAMTALSSQKVAEETPRETNHDAEYTRARARGSCSISIEIEPPRSDATKPGTHGATPAPTATKARQLAVGVSRQQRPHESCSWRGGARYSSATSRRAPRISQKSVRSTPAMAPVMRE